jgi:hypothetical protein
VVVSVHGMSGMHQKADISNWQAYAGVQQNQMYPTVLTE